MNYTVMQNTLEADFAILNEKHFNGLLDCDVLEVDDMDTEWGSCTDDDDTIVLSITRKFPTREIYLDVLAHEMIHLWQMHKGIKVDHGVSFEFWSDYFSDQGRDILITM